MGRVDADSKNERDDEATAESESSESKREQVDAQVDADDGDEGDEPREIVRVGEEVDQGISPTQLGATRYVMAGFFVSSIAVAYVIGRMVSAGWSKLASTQSIVDKAGWLTYVGEDGRETYGTLVGGLIAAGILVYVYRREDIRTWVHEAATELAKVTWPNKKEVTNGTVVVVVASIIATIYLALLDRFWGFVTDLVYRA
jgi:preprotein translocase subunit SecE